MKKFLKLVKESSSIDLSEINSMIDYTLLDESANGQDILELCRKADSLGVKSVCVLPKMVKIAAEELKNSKVLVCTVISFPGGFGDAKEKESVAKTVISNGADEIDMVMNYTLLTQSDKYTSSIHTLKDFLYGDHLTTEVDVVSKICHSSINKEGKFVTLKVIVESGSLTNEQTKIATLICARGGADYIKTSTGKSQVGAQLDKVKIMYNTLREGGRIIKIKASGGINGISQINQYLPYVDRFGMGSASVDRLNNLPTTTNKRVNY